MDGKETIYDSSKELFEETASREKFKSNIFTELMLDYSTDMSVREASRRLNRIRWESIGISAQTYRNTVEREGAAINEVIDERCFEVLQENGFGINGQLDENSEFTPETSQYIKAEEIIRAMENLNIKKAHVSDYESEEIAVDISVDDVCVKRQTEIRPRGELEQPKKVNNTVIHVENVKGKYILNAGSVFGALRLLIGFLLCVGLLRKHLVFFTDGAREIHNEIARLFRFANYKIILDWYHLKKKCKEQLSMALKNATIRNEFLEELLPCLWFGNINGAIKLLQNIDPKKVKNFEFITKLVEYFERVRAYVPCYALRKELGLRNSSNLGEKSNDLIVSSRQKNNGMSWSDDGSHSFASVSAVYRNHQLSNWAHSRSINFDFVPFDEAV